MTQLELLHKQILKEQTRIEMLKNTKSNGDAEWYDFVQSEINQAKDKISKLQLQFNTEYNNN
jgi:hypothetical protein